MKNEINISEPETAYRAPLIVTMTNDHAIPSLIMAPYIIIDKNVDPAEKRDKHTVLNIIASNTIFLQNYRYVNSADVPHKTPKDFYVKFVRAAIGREYTSIISRKIACSPYDSNQQV